MIKDINGKGLQIGDKVVCQDYSGLSIGVIVKFTTSIVKIEMHTPCSGLRLIHHEFSHSKICIINGCN